MAALWRQAVHWFAPVWNPMACLPYDDWHDTYEAGYPTHAKDLLNRLTIIQKKALRLGLQGDQRTPLKGHGLDFADLREYFPGDDIRKIDWNVYARTRQPHIKEYLEEKQLTSFLVVDLSPSMFLGHRRTKAQLAVDLAGLLGLMLEAANHKIGLAVLYGETLRHVQPRQGRLHLQALLQQLLSAYGEASGNRVCQPEGWLSAQLARIRGMLSRHATVFFLSDFLDAGTDWEGQLGAMSHQCELTSVMIQDPCDVTLPPPAMGLMLLGDPEGAGRVMLDATDALNRRILERQLGSHRLAVEGVLRSMGPVLFAGTDEEPVAMLVRLLTKRSGGA
ncbi:MAG: DUF58 domain-containing protein [Candidatus Melainabacteria bacterium]